MKNKKVFVISPGSQPEMIQIAQSLSENEIDFKFFTAGVISDESMLLRITNKFRCNEKMHNLLLLRMRRLPKSHLKNIGFFLEVLIFLADERIRAGLIKFRNFWFAIRVTPYIFFFRPKLVITQAHSNAILIALAKRLKIQTMLNISIAHHDWMLSEFEYESRLNPEWSIFLQHDRLSRFERINLENEIKSADFFLASSSFTVDTFVAHGCDRTKFHIVPLGFDSSTFISKSEPSHRSGIIYVGQLTQRKGISYLIDVYHKVNESNRVDLKIIGRDTGQMASKFSQLGIPIRSHMNHSSLNEEMLRSKYLLLPSLAEGFGLSALEAMATGMIVIISNRTFGNDIISNGVNGYVVDARDTISIANIILTIESDSNLASNLSNAAADTAKLFTWKNYRDNVFLIVRSKLNYL